MPMISSLNDFVSDRMGVPRVITIMKICNQLGVPSKTVTDWKALVESITFGYSGNLCSSDF